MQHKLSHQIFLGIIVLLALISMLVVFFIQNRPRYALGSVAQGNSYQSTTTPLVGFTQDSQIATTSEGVLGSVNITATSTGGFILYDATTSDATKRTVKATTTLASFTTTLTTGTYTFDSNVTSGGILIHTYGSNQASTTITFR